jgi:predicted nucleic acid-binding Zn ribbon protein
MVLNPAIVEEAAEYSKLYNTWNTIIDEAFMNKRETANEEAEDFVFDDARMKDRINAAKLHDHSRVRELSRQQLVIETDHPGWMQILQYKQQRLLIAAQHRFPSLDIKKIRFILAKSGGVN